MELERSVNALLDPGLAIIEKSDGGSDESSGTGGDPAENSTAEEPHLKPSKKKSKSKLVSELFKKKKSKRPMSLYDDASRKDGSLRRSNSWDTLQKPNKNKASKEVKTYVYKSKRRERKKSDHSTIVTDTPSTIEEEADSANDKQAGTTTVPTRNESGQFIPLRDMEIEEAATAYEEPLSILTKDKLKKEAATSPKPHKPPRRQSAPILIPTCVPKPLKHQSFSELDVIMPQPLIMESRQQQQESTDNGDVSLLRIRTLVVQLPQDPVRKYEAETDSKELIPVVSLDSKPPSDGMFCTYSINGKQSRFESTLQPFIPVKQVAVWDQTDDDACFYTTSSQQLFITSRKLPLSEAENGAMYELLSHKAKSECVGVGILPLSTLDSEKVAKIESIENWTETPSAMSEMTMELKPNGSVLLGLSYQALHPQYPVSCSGVVTITGVSGVDCFRQDQPCWTCCSLEIDSVEYGTTDSVLAMEDILGKGWPDNPIEFDAKMSKLCKITISGLSTEEIEYWFGECVVPLAMILPYSQQIVTQDEVDGPVTLLEPFTRTITMPVEPRGSVELQFSVTPVEEVDPEEEEKRIEETIRALEESGMFAPNTIEHLKRSTLQQASTAIIVEEEEPVSSRDIKSPCGGSIYESGAYDHLTSTPPTSPDSTAPSGNKIYHNALYVSPSTVSTLTKSVRSKKLSMRLLDNLKLQVPKSYDEQKFKINTDISDPFREMEIMKTELKDVKARLATSEFMREKAEVEAKNLREENLVLKQKLKKKNRK